MITSSVDGKMSGPEFQVALVLPDLRREESLASALCSVAHLAKLSELPVARPWRDAARGRRGAGPKDVDRRAAHHHHKRRPAALVSREGGGAGASVGTRGLGMLGRGSLLCGRRRTPSTWVFEGPLRVHLDGGRHEWKCGTRRTGDLRLVYNMHMDMDMHMHMHELR